MRRLTLKQKLFVNEYLKHKNGSKAAMKTYNVKNENVARNIASTNLTKPNIKMTIDKVLQAAKYNPINSVHNLIEIESTPTKKITGSDKINASKLLLSLSGMLIEKSTTLNYNIDTYDNYKLLNVKDKYKKLIGKRRG